MKLTNNLDVSWGNARKITPRNVTLFLQSSRRIAGGIIASAFFAHSPVVMITVTLVQLFFEEFANYIGEATKPESKSTTETTMDEDAKETVITTTTTVPKQDKETE